MKSFGTLIFILLCIFSTKAEVRKDTANIPNYAARKRLTWGVAAVGVIGTHSLLYKTWYKTGTSSKFHWINDNYNWKQIDKFGHFWTSSTITLNMGAAFKWSGYSQKKSAIYGGLIALAFQTPIEYFDGRSPDWGASAGDLMANTTGTLFAASQLYCWGERRIALRFSPRLSRYAAIRPNMLGSNLPERILKDYNAQTYWLDINFSKLKLNLKNWPKWLGIGIGYGADGLLGGDDNIWQDKNGVVYDYSSIPRYRQYYISPTVNLSQIQTDKEWLKILGFISDRVRVPLPTLEYNRVQKFRFHWFF